MYNNTIREILEPAIINFVSEYDDNCNSITGKLWRQPIIGYADVKHPYIQKLPEIIGLKHQRPEDVMQDARIILCCFVPFTKEIAQSNKSTEELASPAWAQAYEFTNAMFPRLNEMIINVLAEQGYKGKVSPEALVFDNRVLISNWSQRHFAYAAGIGTFGVNNMLITKAGCSGRLTTVVTNLDIEAGDIMKEELCLYKQKGTCGVCVKHCPTKALTLDGYDRKSCYAQCWENAKVHTRFGNSYLSGDGKTNSAGSEVCGKCVTYAPCTYKEF